MNTILGEQAFSSQPTRDAEPMLGQCCPAVYDVGTALTQHWFNVSCLLGGQWLYHIISQVKNEMNRALGHLCAHIG